MPSTPPPAKLVSPAPSSAASPSAVDGDRRIAGRAFSPAKLAHVVLRARRYAEAIEWWSTLLAARVVFTSPLITFMTYDDEHHRVAILNAGPEAADASSGVGLDHVAFTFATLGHLLETYARLRDHGIHPSWCINHGPTTSIYYRDPDGLQAELQIDNFPDEASLRTWFATGAFSKNPIGVEFDPELLVRRYEEGVPVAELVKQGSASA